MNKNIIARVVKQLHQLAQLPEILMRQYQICMPLFFYPAKLNKICLLLHYSATR